MAINDTKKNVLLGQSVEEQVKNIDDNFTSLFDTVDDLNDGINNSGFITKDVNDLTNYTVKTETGTDIELSLDTKNYKMTLNLKNEAGTIVSTATIDFPIESMVVNATYASGTLTLTLQNGTTLDVDISAIISGLVPDTRTVNGKKLNVNVTLTQDDVGDGTTYKRFSQTEKTKLSGIAEGANKYTHPSYTTRTKGLYKITVDATGHVSAVEEVGVASTTADGLMSKTDKANVDENTAARHSHGNKTLLDTYDQTNENIKDAVTKKHSHINKTVLDDTTASYTMEEKEKLAAIDDSLKNVTADQIGKVKDVKVNGTSVLGTDGVAAITIEALKANFVSVATTDSVWKTNGITVNGTIYQAIRVEKTDTALGVFNSSGQEMVVQKVYDDSYLYLCIGTEKVACTIRKLSGGAVGTGGSGDVTAAGDNIFTGRNIFTYGSIVASKTDSLNKTMKVEYGSNAIAYTTYGETKSNLISFPGKDGTFALTSDIPSANVTLSGSEPTLSSLKIGDTTYKVTTINDIPTVTHKYLHQLYITGRDTSEEDFAINALCVNNSDTLITTYNQLLTEVAVRRMPATGYCGGAHSTKFVSYLKQSKNHSNFITIHTFNSNGSTDIDINPGAIPDGGIIDTMTKL